MKRTALSIALLSLIGLVASAVTIPNTSVTYDVVYHWGFITKVAGQGYVSYHGSESGFYGDIQGHSIPWDGRIYTVHSSLSAAFGPERDGVSPETILAMSGVYSKPEVGANPNNAPYKTIAGRGTLDASSQTMEAVDILTNMISMYYYAHQLGFGTMPAGKRLEIPVIQGGREQTLYITYNGVENYSYGGYNSEAYSIVFQYSYNGQPDRYPIACLIGTDNRLPLKFSADLLIGHIEMCYVP